MLFLMSRNSLDTQAKPTHRPTETLANSDDHAFLLSLLIPYTLNLTPPSMTNKNVSNLSFADRLWKAADALRGQVDAGHFKPGLGGTLPRGILRDSLTMVAR